ncbi:unnamed protein product [Penicillium manginii]
MPPPTRQFHRLSIGQMPARDSRSARAGRADPSERLREDNTSPEESGEEEDSEQSSDEEDESEDESVAVGTSTVSAHSGITYDLSHLDTQSEAHALVGLGEQIDVVNARASSTGYDFELSDRPRVHVGKDSTTCTCSAFQERPEAACHHIFWVLDQLHGCFPSNPPPPSDEGVTLSPDGRPQVGARIEDLLEGQLEAVTGRLDWQYMRIDGDGRRTGMTRAEKLRDILSAFNSSILTENFRQDLVEKTTHARTAEQCVVQGDVEATIFRLAMLNDGLFIDLCKSQPAQACASIYFDKIQEQCRRLLRDFDRYCATGERPTDPGSPGGGMVEVDEVVAQLRKLVQHIRMNIALRSPHGSEGAAKALVSILEAVTARNKDPLDGNNWGRSSFHGEDEDQRNLYHLLIGSEDSDIDSDEELFVIDALESLAPSDLYQFINQLQPIQQRMEVNRAPKAFLLRLGALVRRAQSAGSEIASGSGHKRPAAGGPGGYSKRTR